MTALIFATTALLAIAIVAGRALTRRRVAKARLELPGHSPTTAIRIRRFDEIEGRLLAEPCSCGGTVSLLSEGTRSFQSVSVRVLHTECDRCEAVIDLFFDQSELVH